ncbi:MAG: sigma 54-interacting transcriptional regulator [Clostridia bacterium]|nr:sigma 54-interacting transcriptional regulator [Clostridia bacterium]
MTPLLIVAAHETDAAASRTIIQETGIQAQVISANAQNVTDLVRGQLGEDGGVAVVYGQLASILKKQRNILVVDVVLTGQDMAVLLESACRRIGHAHPHVAFIGQRHMFSNPEPFGRILQADVFLYYVSSEAEIPGAIERAREAGVELIIGDEQIGSAAQSAGFAFMPIGTARDSLISALRIARRLSDSLVWERINAQTMRSLIQHSPSAVIRLNAQGEIVFVNAQAEKAIGKSGDEILGRKLLSLEELTPSSGLVRAIENRQDAYAIVLQFPRASYMADIAAITVEDENDGWMISMQEFAAIDDLDERIRQERSRRGYIAHEKFSHFPARSPQMRAVLDEVEAYAQYDVPILLTGEPRLPKARIAECIHNASLRRRNPFVSVDLGTIPPENQFDLLFGRPGGGDIGLVGQAHKGTLFLLDVHTLVPDCQRQLLSILRSGSFRRKDALEPIPVSVRLICSTFVDLMDLVRSGQWMWQLANTLLGLSLRVPPIREMPEDIPFYIQEYMDISAKKFKKSVSITDEAMEHLCHYPWPSNLRDIEYFCIKATMLAREPVIGLAFVKEKLLPDLEEGEKEQSAHIVADREELAIRRVLRETGNNRNLACEKLGMSRSTLWRKMKKYQIEG